MYPLVETIRLEDGYFHSLPWHQQRLERAFRRHYPGSAPWDLDVLLTDSTARGCRTAGAAPGLFKARFLYSDRSWDLEIAPYRPRHPQTLRLLDSPPFDSASKYTDRSRLEALYACRHPAEDILILMDGEVKDTFSANIAFFDGTRWLTPANPLLPGTARTRLLAEGRILAAPLRRDDLARMKGWTLLNAMIGFDPARFRPPESLLSV